MQDQTLLQQANLMAEDMELDENGQPVEGAPVVTAG